MALFSLDKSDAIPVDTHVWQLALRYYCPHLKDRSLTPKARLPPVLFKARCLLHCCVG